MTDLKRPQEGSELDQSIWLFVQWIRRKIKLHHRPQPRVRNYREGDIWWASLGHNVGSEQNGKNKGFERPVLVLKSISRDLFLGVPITTKLKRSQWHHSFSTSRGERCLLFSQLRALSVKRLLRHVERMEDAELGRVQERVAKIFLNKADPPARAGGSSEPLMREL